MITGITWFDNSSKPLKEKIEAAAKGYKEKTGDEPTTCMVHPSESGQLTKVGEIDVIPARQILPGYIWIGTTEVEIQSLSPDTDYRPE